MSGLLNKINPLSKTTPVEHSQGNTVNTGVPYSENAHHGSALHGEQQPAFRENVFDERTTGHGTTHGTTHGTHGTHGLGQDNLRRTDAPLEGGLHSSTHGHGHHTGTTGGALHGNIPGQATHGNRNTTTTTGLGHDGLSRHDAALEGRNVGTTGGLHENIAGQHATHGTSNIGGRENLSRHDAALEGRNVGTTGGVHENIPGHHNTAHGSRNTTTGLGHDGLNRHDATLEGSNIASRDHHASGPRNDLHTANLGRHDIPGEDLSHGHSAANTTTTATGPVHKSKLLNKFDPRVHEHKEGGLGATENTHSHGHGHHGHAAGTTNLAGRDPLDATQVPPSVMQQYRGPPIIEHGYPEDSKHKRHSVSHQEDHVLR